MTSLRTAFLVFTVFVVLVSNGHAIAAPTCGSFVARFIEGAANKMPVPEFNLEGVNSEDHHRKYFKITTFDDVQEPLLVCDHGWVNSFMANANSAEEMAQVHVSTVTTIALYAYGMEWNEAANASRCLTRTAKAIGPLAPQMSGFLIEDAAEASRASLIISFAGSASFVIDHEIDDTTAIRGIGKCGN